MSMRALLVLLLLLATPGRVLANNAPNAVTEWAGIIQQAIHGPSAPRSAGTSQILHTMVMLAVYDAVVAIEGGYRPFLSRIDPAPGADVRAAVATAAYLTAKPRMASPLLPYLEEQYATYMSGIPEGPAKTDGITVGSTAALGMLITRGNDGFGNVVPYECSDVPLPVGEFEPDTACPSGPGAPQPVDVKLRQIKPFTFADPDAFRPDGPSAMTSREYTDDFSETRDYGRADSMFRSAEQTDIAYFWSENPYVHWNRNLINLAISRDMDAINAARFFALVHTTVSDAIIAGFEAKYYYSAWRPRTAIPLGEADGNPLTDADPSWQPLLRVNHPEYPSGHGFWSRALIDAVSAFFGTHRVIWTIGTSRAAVPALVQTERTYRDLNALMREIGNARVWGGLHWRHSVRHGEQIGRQVARHVIANYFLPMQ